MSQENATQKTETTDNDELRRSSRDRKQTERMEEYVLEELKKRVKRLENAYERWKKQVRLCKESIQKELQSEELGKLLDSLKENETDVLNIFENFRSASTPTPDIVRKVDACVAITADMSKIINEVISGVLDFNEDCINKLRKGQYAASIFTQTSERSHTSTKLSDKVAEAAYDLAEKQANLAAQEEENKYSLQLEIKKAELKQLETKKDVEVAKAKLNELKRAEENLNDIDHVNIKHETDETPNVQRAKHIELGAKPKVTKHSDTKPKAEASTVNAYLKHEPVICDFVPMSTNVTRSTDKLNVSTHAFPYAPYKSFVPQLPDSWTNTIPTQVHFTTASTPHVSQSAFTFQHDSAYVPQPNVANVNSNDSQINSNEAITSLARAITDSLNLSRLPVPEPSIFSGDPLRYIEWKTSFQMLIEHRGIPTSEKIFYLKKYLSGDARKAVEGFLYNNNESTFDKAWKVLEERYGHPFIMQKAFRDKLDKWPRIPNRDPIAFRDFTDFLQGCLDAVPHVPSLSILNDCTENQRLIGKLPDWASNRWNREVSQHLQSTSMYPTFGQFVEFMVREARIACNPISSHYALHDDRKVNREYKGNKPAVKSFATNVQRPSNIPNESKVLSCLYCEMKGHIISKCRKFDALTIDQRREVIKDKKLCFGCLKVGHLNNECRNKLTCIVCKGRHPTCMHEERQPTVAKRERDVDLSNKQVTSLKVKRNLPFSDEYRSTSMIVPVWVSPENDPSSEILVYALLDTQSDTTFIHEETERALNIRGEPVKLNLSTMTSQQTVIDSKRITNLIVRGFRSTEKIKINCAYTRGFIPVDKTHIPTNKTAEQFNHLHEIVNEIPPLQSCDVGLLIGYNCPQALAPRKIITGKGSEPYAIKTRLGWSIVGYANDVLKNGDAITHRISVKELPPICTPRDVVKVLESDFKDINSQHKISQDDLKFLQTLEQSIHQREVGHYEMPLPFKLRPLLPNNKRLAEIRLDHLKRRLRSNERYFNQYQEFIEEMLKRGDAELAKVNNSDCSKWFIPHHGVFHPKKPKKLRVVFDCSAKYGGTSLNEYLLTGPDLTNCLAGVLCRFRKSPIAIMCDIEKMFHQFYVNEEDRDYLRFLWWENNDLTKDPSEYRMNVHLFGAASSPGCANYGLKHLAKSNEETFPQAATFIQNNFYVDDGLVSVESVEEAKQLIRDAQLLCSQGGLRLHKFVSNSTAVIDSVPKSERATNVNKMDLGLEKIPIERALGVNWSVEEDSFEFNIQIKETKPTRRNMLSIVASIYDPLGFLAPFTLNGKRILQFMCQNGMSWDDPLPDCNVPEWNDWIHDIRNLVNFKIPRCIKPPGFENPSRIELHHFSDASTSGYGQCSYIRFISENAIHCAFLMGKARVAPTTVVTIPRLELTAAVLSVKMSMFLREEIGVPISKEYFWTDSKVVLSYIKNDARRFHVFVANRVQMIRESSDLNQWYYVESSQNPADYASRGLSANDISTSSWLSGPKFLWERELPETTIESELKLGDPEVRACRSLCTKASTSFDLLERFERFSSWRIAVSVAARITRLANGIKGFHSPSVEERRNAEHVLIRNVQQSVFPGEINILKASKPLPRTSKLFALDPILSDNLLRVGGRLKNAQLDDVAKHPIILPKRHHITNLIISNVHDSVHHQGRGITANQLRVNGYWIVGGSKTVANFIHKCVICRKLRRPTEVQRMADLPNDRVEVSPPFTYVGMDCFGPFTVKQGRKEIKRYGLLFTCFCSRAVHIEMLDDMSTDSFINGLRCFMALRGRVQQIRCDQGSNFVGAKNEFERLKLDKVSNFLTEKQCNFIMNAPYSSHTGGIWERQIRTVRNVLTAILMQHPGRLDDFCLRTFLYESMYIVNSRPLTVSNIDDPNALEPLTPTISSLRNLNLRHHLLENL